MKAGKIWICLALAVSLVFNNVSISQAATIIGITAELKSGVKIWAGKGGILTIDDVDVRRIYSDGTSDDDADEDDIFFIIPDEDGEVNDLEDGGEDRIDLDDIDQMLEEDGAVTVYVRYEHTRDDFFYTTLYLSADGSENPDNPFYDKTLDSIYAEYTGPKVAVGEVVKKSDVIVYAVYVVELYDDLDEKDDDKEYRVTERLGSNQWDLPFNAVQKGVNNFRVTYKYGNKTMTAYFQVESSDADGEWVLEGDAWRYVYPNGTYLQGDWVQTAGKWYYLDQYGYMVKSTTMDIGSETYRFRGNGEMVSDWVLLDGDWYYYDETGAQADGWVKQGTSWYYLNKYGVMQIGWVLVDDLWYFFDVNSGAMQTGWLSRGGLWYFLDLVNGHMRTGWVQAGDKWYYMDVGGTMVTNTWVGNNYVDGAGIWTLTR